MDSAVKKMEQARFLLKQGQRAEAVYLLDEVLREAPHYGPAAGARIQLAFECGEYEAAIPLLERLMQQLPGNKEAARLMIRALSETGRWAEVCEHYAQLQRSDENPITLCEPYAEALCRAGDFAGAITQYEMMGTHEKLNPDVLHALGHCYNALGEFGKAATVFDEGLSYNPQHAPCRNARMLLTLKTSNMQQGLEAYVLRYKTGGMALRQYPFPVWEGQALNGKKLLIWGEQGMGDVMMFSGFLPKVMEECAAVTLEMYPAMMKLFARSFPGLEVTPLYDVPNSDFLGRDFDYHCPMGNFLLLLNEYKPAVKPQFLQADSQRVTHYKYWLGNLGADRKIGISWYTEMKESGPIRNIPLPLWKPVLEVPGCQFISLQYGECERELNEFTTATGKVIHRDAVLDPLQDKEGFAALISALDGVISIQNSTVHMAGALGVPAWILLSACSDFRWGVNKDNSDLYARVKILRQRHYGDWEEVMWQAAAMLRNTK